MRRKEKRFVRTFDATDQKGKKHELEHYEIVSHNTPLSGPSSVTKHLDEIQTENGDRVIPLGGGKYQVDGTDIILQSTDPKAP
jgi:hypothetical protein